MALLGVAGVLGCEEPPDLPKARFLRQIEWVGTGSWRKADLHCHTKFSDGRNTVAEVVAKAADFGCQVIAITDHADQDLQAGTPEYVDAINKADGSYRKIDVLAGLEWNVPPWNGKEHATILVPAVTASSNTLWHFRTRFDDYLRETDETAPAQEAMRWLRDQHANAAALPVIMLNHPSRKRNTSTEIVSDLRSWRETSDLVIGFSGAPGHQAGDPNGSYSGTERTMDRWDPAAARVGDAWDQLLQQGVDVWAAMAPSDFHAHHTDGGIDYWPGEFSETWLYVPERTAAGALRALHAGTFFAGHGHIAREVKLLVDAPGLPREAFVGEVIEVQQHTQIEVSLEVFVPEVDWAGEPNRIDEVELIVLSGDGSSQVIKRALQGPSLIEPLDVGAHGLVVRARGRRIIDDGDDLMFYTNSIRVEVAAAEPASYSVAGHSSR